MDNPEENLMATMTDKELEDHIINPKKYGPLEIAYAVAEMRRRGTFNERNFPRVLEATRKKILPSYYSPDAILVFSFFCPILFSAILFATNLKNQRDKWVVIGGGLTLSVFVVIMNATFNLEEIWYVYFKGFGFVLMWPVWNKFLGEDDPYVKKPFWPLAIIGIIFFALRVYLLHLYPDASLLLFL